MKSIWNHEDYRELRGRLERLTPDAGARWGKMTAPEMVCHCTDALKMINGDGRGVCSATATWIIT